MVEFLVAQTVNAVDTVNQASTEVKEKCVQVSFEKLLLYYL